LTGKRHSAAIVPTALLLLLVKSISNLLVVLRLPLPEGATRSKLIYS
jgi:hypothetical protein